MSKAERILGVIAAVVILVIAGMTYWAAGKGGDAVQAVSVQEESQPVPKFAGITQAEALTLAQADDFRINAGMTRAEYLDALGQDWMASATSYSRVECNGRPFWRLTFKYDEPRPWYESKRRGFNVGFDDCNTARPSDIYRHAA
jgi:hypothetical protein